MMLQAKLLDKNKAVFICDDNATLDRVKDICDGEKVRLEPKVIFPVLSLPKLARIFPRGWQSITDEATRTKLMEVSAAVRYRRLHLQALRDEYRGNGAIAFTYEFKGVYAPLRHQLTMARCVSELPKCGLLADPGTCKTAAYLWGLHKRILTGTVKRALVITLSHLKENVLGEAKLQAPDLKCVVMDGKAHADKIMNKKYLTQRLKRDYDIYIANYESMAGIVTVIPEGFFDAVVLDEGHRIGNATTQQTKAIVGAFENVPYKYIVTGTLVANNELSFFMPFRFMGPDTVPEADYFCFRSKHFYTVDPDYRIWVAEGVTKDLVREQITKAAVGFRKDECVDLPGVIHSVLHYDLAGDQAEAYAKAKTDLIFTITAACGACTTKDKCLECPNTILIKNALVMVNKLAQISCGFFIETRVKYDVSGKSKNDNVIHWFKSNPKLDLLISSLNNIPGDSKVVVWSNFVAGIKLICDRIALAFGPKSFIPVYGDVDAFAATNRFRDEPGLRYFVANPAKAGTGLNIQFSNYMFFYSNDYSYIKRDQAISRQDRQGQKEKVEVTDLTGRISGKWAVDHGILSVLNGKKCLANSLTLMAQAAGLNNTQYGAGVKATAEENGQRETPAVEDPGRPPWNE